MADATASFGVQPIPDYGLINVDQLNADAAASQQAIADYEASLYGGRSGGTTGGTSGGTTGPAPLTSQELAAYNQAIGNTNQAIDRLPTQLESGYSSIDAQRNNALNQLLLGKNRANETYDTNKLETGQDYVGSKNTIGSQAGSLLSGLWRLLGSRGAGGGSAYRNLAPGAVARQATLQRGDVSTQFGKNNRLLDTNWNTFLQDYANSRLDVKDQRAQAREKLQSFITTNKSELLQQLADLTSKRDQNVASGQPYIDQANTLLDKVANYKTDPIKYKVGAYTAPSLESYIARPGATPTYQGTAASDDYTSPYLAALLRKQQPVGV